MRLDKFVASSSDFSRAEVKRLIKNKSITINDNVSTNPAQKINDADHIKYLGQILEAPCSRYFMLHKPMGYLCATQDSDAQTVIDLLDEHNKQTLQIAGRLDKDTTGLVFITDDGQWNHRVTSPKKHCFKKYRVTLTEPIHRDAIEKLTQGVQLHHEKQATLPATVRTINEHTIELSIQEGKYHQVKRMLAAVGNHVKTLHRHQIATITLDKRLAPGEYRPLSREEINSIL